MPLPQGISLDQAALLAERLLGKRGVREFTVKPDSWIARYEGRRMRMYTVEGGLRIQIVGPMGGTAKSGPMAGYITVSAHYEASPRAFAELKGELLEAFRSVGDVEAARESLARPRGAGRSTKTPPSRP